LYILVHSMYKFVNPSAGDIPPVPLQIEELP